MQSSRISGFRCVLASAALSASCHHEPSGVQLNWSNDAQSVVVPAPLASGSSAVAAAPLASAHSGADAGVEVPPTAQALASAVPAPAPDSSSRATEDSARPSSALLDAQGKPLPQTDERPSVTTAAFRERIALVAQAIQNGNAEPAFVAFFPLVAYQQVKDVAKPERDYRFRLLANFKRDVLEYHHALGAAATEAKFSGVTVSERDAKWMAPGSEGNKLGYFRVLRSHLHFTLPTGRTRDFELTSMISWRGEWYVVHLHGFK